MWFIVKTDVFSEQDSIDFLKKKYPQVIADVYFPLGRKTYANEKGEEKARFVPLIQGLFFIKANDRRMLQAILSPYGYFVYRGMEHSASENKFVERTFFTKAHLLCPNCSELTLDEIVDKARVPDEDMERFIYYTEKIADGIEGLSIVDKRYSDLVNENDTIRILNGPMEGWTGVVKQIKQKGKKDRHLLVRFGNDRCLNISNIRKYDMQIVREATKGARSEAVGVWRAIDQLVGYLQNRNPQADAPAMLRQMLKDYQAKPTITRCGSMTDKEYQRRKQKREEDNKECIIGKLDASMHKNFRILAKFFDTGNATAEKGLVELIPDSQLRPFLTPTSGTAIPEGKSYAMLCHTDFQELIMRCNLRKFFRDKEYDADKYAPVFDEDYEYYAHFALLQTLDGKVKVATSWGGFYTYYNNLSADERLKFDKDLEAKRYPHFRHLLADGSFRFEENNGIGGFAVELDVEYTDDAELLGQRVAPVIASSAFLAQTTAAAVEIWQGTRLLLWRQLLQRHVLLHKVPVADMPSVIPVDKRLEAAFERRNGRIDVGGIIMAVDAKCSLIRGCLHNGELAQAVLALLSLAHSLSRHFAKDELYNHISDAFNPDAACSAIFEDILKEMDKAENERNSRNSMCHLAAHLHKGMAELQTMDAWTYFKFPSFLKDIHIAERKAKARKR